MVFQVFERILSQTFGIYQPMHKTDQNVDKQNKIYNMLVMYINLKEKNTNYMSHT